MAGLSPVLFDPETGELVEPPPSLDYFSVFGLKRSFTLNTDELAVCKAAKFMIDNIFDVRYFL